MANCQICGKNTDLVGIRHNCTPAYDDNETFYGGPRGGGMTDQTISAFIDRAESSDWSEAISNMETAQTYRYRDREKRKAYMREYMRKKRAK